MRFDFKSSLLFAAFLLNVTKLSAQNQPGQDSISGIIYVQYVVDSLYQLSDVKLHSISCDDCDKSEVEQSVGKQAIELIKSSAYDFKTVSENYPETRFIGMRFLRQVKFSGLLNDDLSLEILR